MEAKDTIMGGDEMLGCSLVSRYPFGEIQDVIRETCEHQAEISFKAGIEEVVEWIGRLYHYNTFEQFPVGGGTATEISESRVMVIKEDDWQAKLKSWYIRGRDEQ